MKNLTCETIPTYPVVKPIPKKQVEAVDANPKLLSRSNKALVLALTLENVDAPAREAVDEMLY
ncbi:MAG: hypothetical protein ACMG6E_04650 [Candidatus Roizmanbacteria bacterium]